MAADQVDDGLGQLEQFLPFAGSASHNDAVPLSLLQSGGDSVFDVVASVETDGARLGVDATIGDGRHRSVDCLDHWLWVPGSGNPMWVEANDEDLKACDRAIHRFTVDQRLPSRLIS